LFTVIIASCVAATFILLPLPFRDFGQSIVATSLFASNALFWAESGYFDLQAHAKPLLHTWSLAVEEQFYIAFPLVLLLAFGWLKSRWALALLPIAAASLLLSIYGATHFESAAFYFAPTRAWELLLGAMLAASVVPPFRARALNELAAAAGMGLIAFSFAAISEADLFPGALALLPCAGAALLIHAGEAGTTAVNRALSLRPVVFVGLISYSLYLWHWPLLVFTEQYYIDTMPRSAAIAAVGLAVILAIISWRYIEKPFRGKQAILDRKGLFTAAGAAMAATVAFGAFVHVTAGWPGRAAPEVVELAAFKDAINPRRAACMGKSGRWIDAQKACVYGADVAPTYAIWGDSHADTVIQELGESAARFGRAVKYFGYEACPPALGVRTRHDADHLCLEHNEDVVAYLASNREIATVFLIARHAAYLAGNTLDFGPAEAWEQPFLVTDADLTALDLEARQHTYEEAFAAAVARLQSAGKTVVLFYPIPETAYDIPSTLAKVAMRGGDPEQFARPAEYFYRRNAFVFEMLDRIDGEGVLRIYPHQYLCDDRVCKVMNAGQVLYADDDHLSRAGARYITPLFERVIEAEEQGAIALDSEPARRPRDDLARSGLQ
jgi:peptidoglycan/LPS O-acetylase OafA/YrhL